ncbi:MAG: hypothetical protein VXY83_04670 [Pseudomonadota bacterium]|nr:hypothetical protein [Magnetococcales bacterium]MEC8066286.1 hypothetical protein [Pseudomonadota bacterium]MEC8467634.1 hypothetical protein [Pseudomonadota bacterium]|tara:strand:+ start:6648 stop:7154 length:507 start_codon:yes stop_codon:yes gene_type:complete
MMKFTLGIAILVFTAIVGSYKYMENEDLIVAKKRGLIEAKDKLDRYQRIEQRSKQIPKFAVVRGDDKKNIIERLLEIGEPGLKFNFIGQARRQDAHLGIIRHTFKITGPATFNETQELLKKMQTLPSLPGFVIYNLCFGCGATNEQLAEDQHMINIEGYLYAYDPNII